MQKKKKVVSEEANLNKLIFQNFFLIIIQQFSWPIGDDSNQIRTLLENNRH